MDLGFHGRKDILTLIRRRTADLREGYRQNIALLGGQYVGKSALLRQFLLDLDDAGVIPVYLDLEGRDVHYFISKFTRSILYHFSRLKGLASADAVADLCAAVEPHIPLTAAKARDVNALMEKGRLNEAYDALLSIPEVFSLETGLHCVVILDEFQVLEDFGVNDVFRRLADRITAQKKTLYIVSSSYEGTARRILTEQLTLLFGSFEIIEVNPFNLRQSHAFIASRMGSVRLGMPLRNFLADFTGGRPLYLDILLNELVNLSAIYKQPEVYSPLLTQAIENVVFSRWGVLSRHFELVVLKLGAGKTSRLVSDLLIAMARGACRVKDIAHSAGAAKLSLVTQKLNFLADEDIVEKNGSHFHIKDKLFRYWIRYVFSRRLHSIELELQQSARDFKNEVVRGINDFNAACGQDLAARVTDLLHCFDNDCVNVQGRKYRLPAFTDVQRLESSSAGGVSGDSLLAQTSSGPWFLALKRGPLSEADINGVAQEVLRAGVKPHRCVIVSLASMDDGARLKALEERMWVWNEPELNSLMNLFNKPYIFI
jgi:hypothetical protein